MYYISSTLQNKQPLIDSRVWGFVPYLTPFLLILFTIFSLFNGVGADWLPCYPLALRDLILL